MGIYAQVKTTKMNYKPFIQLLHKESEIKRIKSLGVVTIHQRDIKKPIVGLICLIVAIVPNGLGLIFYPLAFNMLGFNWTDRVLYLDKARRFIFRLTR